MKEPADVCGLFCFQPSCRTFTIHRDSQLDTRIASRAVCLPPSRRAPFTSCTRAMTYRWGARSRWFGTETAIGKYGHSLKGEGMNSLRLLVLLLAGGLISLSGGYAHAQAEIDPDHYETPAHRMGPPQSSHAKTPAHPNHQSRMVASRHGGKGSRHHHSHAFV